ncbi:Gfo/Idh/MocA family oxidoreductase [Streptomyces sp. NBC_00029]|uniref:Gfo/Idh/MocA family protein n=1 Tax=Streptomyces sp. NBC_00029 TaxID=2903613 RepID=UPI003247707F
MRVGMAGIGFMGRLHSYAWSNASSLFGAEPVELVAVAGGPDDSEEAVRSFARRWGWSAPVCRTEDLIDAHVDVIDVCTPNDSHELISVAALRAGRHVLCEKPMSNSLGGAERMAAAASVAAERGVHSSIGFVYRRIPAVALAKELMDRGELGDVLLVSARFLQDVRLDPARPGSWRSSKEVAGSGVIGDLGAHLVDLVAHLTGEMPTMSSTMTAPYPRRPTDAPLVPFSETEDIAVSNGSLASGALVEMRMSRVAVSRKVDLGIDVFGSRGRLSFELQRPGELVFVQGSDGLQGVVERTVLVTERTHPYQELWWEPGQPVGYGSAHIHQVGDFAAAIRAGRPPTPSFADGLRVQQVLERMILDGKR